MDECEEQYLKRFVISFLVISWIFALVLPLYEGNKLIGYGFTLFLCVTALSLLHQVYKTVGKSKKWTIELIVYLYVWDKVVVDVRNVFIM